MIVHTLHPDLERAWMAFVERSPEAGVFHMRGWKQVFERTYDHRMHYLLAEEDGDVRGVLPLMIVRSRLFGTYVTSLPGGICATSTDAGNALVASAREVAARVDADYLLLRDCRRGWDDSLITDDRHCTLILPLPSTAQQLWEEVPSTVRNRVRKARKAGLTVVAGGEEHLDAFYRIYCHNMRDLGTPVFDKSLARNVLTEFPDRTRILVVVRDERPIGAMFLITCKDFVYNPWVSSLRTFFSECPNDLLYWEALRWACERGFACFDFGRSQWNTGTYRFKAKWGAEPQPLYYQYHLRRGEEIPDASLQVERKVGYRVARWLWQRLPVGVTRVAGPPIVQYVNPIG